MQINHEAKRLLIFCLGDRAHGLGHIQRCIVLSNELARRGVGCVFVTPPDTAGEARLLAAGKTVVACDYDNPEKTLRHIAPNFPALLVDVEASDKYGPCMELLEAVRPSYKTLIGVNGAGWKLAQSGLLDLQICQSILMDISASPTVIGGVENIIIDPRFASLTPNPESGHVVISMGGGDPHNLTVPTVRALADCGRRLLVVIGAAVKDDWQDDWKMIALNSGVNMRMGVEYHIAPPNLLRILDGAALYVGALGMSAYEALAAGVGVVLTNWSSDHVRTSMELERRGVATNMGLWDNIGIVGLCVYTTLADGLNVKMSTRARALVDGLGAARVAERVCQLLTDSK